jgi:peptidyl-tRNA hydrolase, PTH2 family
MRDIPKDYVCDFEQVSGYTHWFDKLPSTPKAEGEIDFTYSQCIIINSDIKEMQKGKAVGQGAHGSVGAFLETYLKNPTVAIEWIKEGQRKVVLKAPEQVILNIAKQIITDDPSMPIFVVRDFGLTQIPKNSLTCIAIGPTEKYRIAKYTKDLKLY